MLHGTCTNFSPSLALANAGSSNSLPVSVFCKGTLRNANSLYRDSANLINFGYLDNFKISFVSIDSYNIPSKALTSHWISVTSRYENANTVNIIYKLVMVFARHSCSLVNMTTCPPKVYHEFASKLAAKTHAMLRSLWLWWDSGRSRDSLTASIRLSNVYKLYCRAVRLSKNLL
jgi:hypothetical protein